MKYIINFILLNLIFTGVIYGCSKENNETNATASDDLVLIPNAGILIKPIENWSIILTDSIEGFKVKCGDSTKFCSNVVFTKTLNENNLDLEEIARLHSSSVEERFKPKFKLIAAQMHEISGLRIATVDYIAVERNIHLGFTTAILLNEEKEIISISCAAINEPEGSYVDYRKLFWEIIKTIRLNN